MPSKVTNANSLILLCPAPVNLQQEVLTAAKEFDSVFALTSSDKPSLDTRLTAVSDTAVGQGLVRRLEFLAEPQSLPYLLAPLLLRHVWSLSATGDVVFAYNGITAERLGAAGQMLKAGCEGVLLRSNDTASVLIGLARNRRSERIIGHWADCVESFSLDSGEQPFDSPIGSQMVQYICDRIGSLRYEDPVPVLHSNGAPETAEVTPLVRSAIKKLMPEFQLLRDDPLGNAVQVLNSAALKVRQDPGNLITCLMSFVWSTRADLQDAFSLSTPEGRRGLVDWFLTRAPIEMNVTDNFLAPIKLARQNRAFPKEQGPSKDFFERPHHLVPDPAAGVNLIGYPRAEMGMGEQLRVCAAALATTDYDFCVNDFSFGIVASHQDTRYQDRIRTDNPFHLNLFHINADQMPLAWNKLGPKFFRDRYNIGYWEWELSNFPDQWQDSIDLVDEIWAPSRFIQDTISKATTKPVVWMPLAIEFPVPAMDRSAKGIRAKLGLPAHPFLFLFPFDFSSFSTRKNFAACIEAFKRAFPEGNDNVGLVLKTIRHPHHKREFWELLRVIGDEKRIYVVDRVLRQVEMRELIGSCDAFVSLHRSEGFGLGIAEAMYLGKPVIATNYSGNIDFTKADNSCLVDYRLIPVRAGEYVFPQDQVWADPNVEAAATYMRHLVADRDYARLIGDAAANFMRQQHSHKVIGERYSKRLKQIAAARALLA